VGNVKIRHYPFDFHTHFWGILPVHPVPGQTYDAQSLESATKQYYNACDEILLSLDVKRRVFALSLRRAFTQFTKWFDITTTPFQMKSFSINSYERGECFVENAIIGWNLIAQKEHGAILPSFWSDGINSETGLAEIEAALEKIENTILNKQIKDLDPADVSKFDAELDRLIKADILSVTGATRIQKILSQPTAKYGDLASKCAIYLGPYFYSIDFLKPASSIYRYYDYFNELMLSANEFTPFDDSYFARDEFKNLNTTVNDEKIECQTYLIDETNKYYGKEGITHTQLSMGRKAKGPLFSRFNTPTDEENGWGAANKILYHNTNHNIGSDPGDLFHFLSQAIADFKKCDSVFTTRVIGVDFLGSESHIDFETLLHVLEKFNNDLTVPVKDPVTDAIIKKSFTLRIHVGEGSGIGADNRSVFGEMCFNTSVAATFANNGPYAGFIDRLLNFRGEVSRRDPLEVWPDTTDLAQKIFAEPYYGLRFNIFSAQTHDRISTIAESNMLSLYHAATKVESDGTYTYGPNSAFEKMSIRLGHGQHARQYIHALSRIRGLAQGFRNITFDTNLGSNFITGSSSNIMSPGDYNRAQGIRTLTSFAPARYVMQAINAVFGTSALSDSLYRNVFPLLIGSDGQGIEHTNLERENIRGLVLSVLRTALMNQYMTDKDLLTVDNLEDMGLADKGLAQNPVVSFVFDDAVKYWETTVGAVGDIATYSVPVSGGAWISEQRIEPMKSGVSGFEYYKAPEFDVRWAG